MKAALQFRTAFAVTLLGSSAMYAPAVLAQTTPTAEGAAQTEPVVNPEPVATAAARGQAEADQTGVGDIIVTAQKRSQSINSVGMAISALGAEQLTSKGISDVSDLARVVPGFNFSSSQKGAPIYTLRGVGFYEESLGASPAVSVYVDEVGYAFPIMAKAATMDLERVEVLKGPQGTLFGQNSTGGAINYIAAKPTSILKAGINASVARFGRFSTDGFISGPITDTLRMRLSAAVDEGGAWQRSASRGTKNGDVDVLKLRLLTEWKPTDAFTATLNLNGWRDKSDSLAAALLQVTPQVPSRATAQMLAQQPVPLKLGLVDWGPDNNLDTDQKFYQAALRLEYRFSDAFQLTSITNSAHFRQNDFRDTDGSPLSIFSVHQDGKIDSFQQELRASGALFEDRLNYVAGGYYARDKTAEDNTYTLIEDTSARAPVSAGLPPFLGTFVPTRQTTKNKAIFGNLDYEISDQFTVHAGARHTWSDTDFNGCMADIDGNFAAFINIVGARINPAFVPVQPGGCLTVNTTTRQSGLVRSSLNEQNTSWRVGLDFKPVARTLFYGTISKGYKSGSFPNINGTTDASFVPVTQESVLAYEVGFKTDLGMRIVQLNGALFYYDYKNKQFRGRVQDPLGVFGAVEALVNVPRSRVKGAEFSATVEPITGLDLNAGVTYLDTKVTSDFTNFDPYGFQANFQGEPFPFTPKWMIQGSIDYKWGLSSSLDAFLGANASHRSRTTSAFGRNSPASIYPYSLVLVDAYTLVDGQLGIAAPSGKWRVTGFVRNLLNKYYYTDAFRQIDNVSRHVGEPRTYGLRVNYNF
ncbi:TonB-dependent receptor [Sphingobium sp. YR768]|uniref:TonB-dependent receptor n=1 Tax=Sphingobium sp. YR768 TaxID=1884365 RepID=UPI0008C7E007|nr:TonB-dependent receptor [Sphingobium sp. YR768]SES12900.1 Outer membrane receptor proteins, mostly Fe transport [Sphingobium sp. YR768]